MTRTFLLFPALLVALPGAAIAAGEMKPGLYEYTMKMDLPGMPFALPPQVGQHCLTPADVASGEQFGDPKNADCAVKDLKQSAGKASFHVACKDGSTGSGEYTYTESGMAGKTVMSTQGHTMTLNVAAKRLGDCK